MKIIPSPLQSIKMQMNKQFSISNAFEECDLKLSPRKSKTDKEEGYLFITYQYTIASLGDEDFKFEVEILKPFTLNPLNELSVELLYQCVLFCQNMLQDLVNILLKECQRPFMVKVLAFEEIKEQLKVALTSLKDGDSGSGS